MPLTRLPLGTAVSGNLPAANYKAGSVIQVQSTFYNTPFSQSISADTDTSIGTANLKVDITPTSTSSKIFLFGRLFQEFGNTNAYDLGFFFRRGTTSIGVGSASGSRPTVMVTNSANYIQNGTYDNNSTPETVSLFHIDSPSSTSQQTYYIGIWSRFAANIHVNRTGNDSDQINDERGSSEIIAMEIAG